MERQSVAPVYRLEQHAAEQMVSKGRMSDLYRVMGEMERSGDLIRLEAAGERFTYIVAQTMTLAEEGQPINVRQDNARWILPTDDERLTLVTCWPYLANSHRLVVVALPPATLGIPSDMP